MVMKLIRLDVNEYLIVANFKTVADIRNMALKADTKIDINGKHIVRNIRNVKMDLLNLLRSISMMEFLSYPMTH